MEGGWWLVVGGVVCGRVGLVCLSRTRAERMGDGGGKKGGRRARRKRLGKSRDQSRGPFLTKQGFLVSDNFVSHNESPTCLVSNFGQLKLSHN